MNLSQQILRTDVAGMPLEWVDYRNAVRLYSVGQVAYSCGSVIFAIRGGINSRTHRQSRIEVNSIIATYGESHAITRMRKEYLPPLSNAALFRRDDQICMYCGNRFPTRFLSRDPAPPS